MPRLRQHSSSSGVAFVKENGADGGDKVIGGIAVTVLVGAAVWKALLEAVG